MKKLDPELRAKKLLFVCSRNEWRSRTAEEIFKKRSGYEVRSAGTEKAARIRVTEGLIGWADIVFVMERKHGEILREKFRPVMDEKTVYCLDIPDEFGFMDPDLIASLESAVSGFLEI